MKTKLVLALLVAGAVSFTSCMKKIDEKTMSEITQFGTDWTGLGEKATNWSNELATTAAKAKEFATQQNTMVASMASSKDEAMKSKIADMASKATADASKFEGMQNEFTSFKTTWDETTNQFSEWKEKVMKGQVNAEEVTKGLADFKTKMSDAQAKIESWNTSFAEAKSSCEQNMAMAESMTTAAPAKK
jgi:chromosome segregation ATPase